MLHIICYTEKHDFPVTHITLQSRKAFRVILCVAISHIFSISFFEAYMSSGQSCPLRNFSDSDPLPLSALCDSLILSVRRKLASQSRSESSKRKNIEKRRSSEQNSKMKRHDENLEVARSRATEFSQTPYLQNLKLRRCAR